MRFRFHGLRRPARVAKLIRRELAALGVEVGLSRAQDIAARAFGYDTFRELKVVAGRDDPSAWDEDVGEDVSDARRERQVRAVAGAALTQAEAERVVDRIRPSSRHLGGGLAPNPGNHGRHGAPGPHLFLIGDPSLLPGTAEGGRRWLDGGSPDAGSGVREIRAAPGTGKSTTIASILARFAEDGLLRMTPLGIAPGKDLPEAR